MKKVLAVALRAPAAFLALSILSALLDAAGATPRTGAAAAFAPASLAAAAGRAVPLVLCVQAWYLAIVAGRRFRSRLAAHATVSLAVAACAAAAFVAFPLVVEPSYVMARADPATGRFIEANGRSVSIEELGDGLARGVAIVAPASNPRSRYLAAAAWDRERGILSAEGEAFGYLEPEATGAPRGSGLRLRGAERLHPWASETRNLAGIAITALSFALLAAGVRFPVRLFAWPLPGAFLGLVFACAAPELYATFGSPVIGEALSYLGVALAPATRQAILASTAGLVLLVADLTFRPPDAPEAAHG